MENPDAKLKEYVIGERDAWGVHGLTVRNENYRLMVWIDKITGDTLEINLFDNHEPPLPYRDISKNNPEIVKNLSEFLENI